MPCALPSKKAGQKRHDTQVLGSPGQAGKRLQRDSAQAKVQPRWLARLTYLIIHELKRQRRLADPSAANHDHFVQGQGALAFALVRSHQEQVESC